MYIVIAFVFSDVVVNVFVVFIVVDDLTNLPLKFGQNQVSTAEI